MVGMSQWKGCGVSEKWLKHRWRALRIGLDTKYAFLYTSSLDLGPPRTPVPFLCVWLAFSTTSTHNDRITTMAEQKSRA